MKETKLNRKLVELKGQDPQCFHKKNMFVHMKGSGQAFSTILPAREGYVSKMCSAIGTQEFFFQVSSMCCRAQPGRTSVAGQRTRIAQPSVALSRN